MTSQRNDPRPLCISILLGQQSQQRGVNRIIQEGGVHTTGSSSRLHLGRSSLLHKDILGLVLLVKRWIMDLRYTMK